MAEFTKVTGYHRKAGSVYRVREFPTATEVLAEHLEECLTCYGLGAEALDGGLVDSGPQTFPRASVITDRIMRPGDIMLIDNYNLSYFGYRTCYYRDFVIGKPTNAQKEAWEKAREYTWDSIRLLKDGVSTRELVENWPKANGVR